MKKRNNSDTITDMNIQTLKGFRDFLPQEKRKRNYVLSKVIEVFEKFGFEPLETPTLEYADLLLGKYGDEADKLVYSFEDKGERRIGLRYDQTVPTARVLAQYFNELPKYFRRYQVQNVFRADKPQKGRYREFTQCDVDIFGSNSPLADAEILACTYFAYKNVGYPEILLKINDRQTLFKTYQPFVTDSVNVFSIIQSIDKLDKLPKEDVIRELVRKGLSNENAEKVMIATETAEVSENLKEIMDAAVKLGIPREALSFSSSLARGLDYYTGMIFEVLINGYEVGSCGGGGRYDKLIQQLGGQDVPAVGIAFGFDRMVDAAEVLGLFPPTIYESAKAYVTIFSKDLEEKSLNITAQLRANNIATEVYVGELGKMEKQLKAADQKGIPYVIIVGPEEAEKNVVTLKNFKERTQEQLTLEEVIKKLK